MKNLLLALFTLAFVLNGLTQNIKVLFLGNSFTYTYDIPDKFEQLANSAGFYVFVDVHAFAGQAVADEQITGHINDPVSQSKITSQQWDYIVVQDNQGNYVNTIGTIPANAGNGNVTLYNQIKANNPCTRIVYFAGWGPEGGVFQGDNTQNCIDRVHGNMIFLNDNIGSEIVSPIGKAWNTSLTQMPSVDLYHSDNVHPSLAGSYLAAATLFTGILKKDPSNLTYTAGINSSTAQNLRTIAYNTVVDPTFFNETNLVSYTPIINVNGSTLSTTWSATYYQWFLDGYPVGTNSNTHIATVNGVYHVILTDSQSGCSLTSFPVELNGCLTAAPTGNVTQSFCDAATVADLSATGTNIQWYDSATGGNLLSGTDALTDGTTYYASQTENGCESQSRLEVTVSVNSNIDVSVSVNGTNIEANATGVTYQWVDCDNNNAPINGETSESFTATVNGNYAVIITDGQCSDTSDCVAISTASLNEEILSLSVYPNPVKNQLTIRSTGSAIQNVKIVSVTGQLVTNIKTDKKAISLNTEDWKTGLYFVDVRTVNGSEIVKVIK